MYVNFEIAALFPSLYSRVKKRGNFKTNIRLDSVESFLYYLSSSITSIKTDVSLKGLSSLRHCAEILTSNLGRTAKTCIFHKKPYKCTALIIS